jgi:hypothetical protein
MKLAKEAVSLAAPCNKLLLFGLNGFRAVYVVSKFGLSDTRMLNPDGQRHMRYEHSRKQ